MDDCGEAVRARLVPQADDGAHDPLPQLLGLELGDGGRPVHEVGIDPGGRLDDGLGEERGPVREVVVDQGRVDAGVARDAAQGGLVAVAGEGGAGRRQDGLARVRTPRWPPPPRAHRSLVSLIVRACPRSTPLGSAPTTRHARILFDKMCRQGVVQMLDRITVHPPITRRHPDIQVADVESAWRSAIAVRRRNYDPPEYYAAAGADSHGRLLEMVGVELDDGSLLIFHAMRLTDKMAQELQVRREST